MSVSSHAVITGRQLNALGTLNPAHVLARPGRIVDSVDVGVPRPREPAVATTPAFRALAARLLAALDGAR